LIAAVNDQGRSYIAQAGPTPAILINEGRPGYANHNIWRTTATPAPIDAADSITAHAGVLPPAGGTIIRIIDIPPESRDPEERRRQAEAVFRQMFADARHAPQSDRHPGMHTTDTIDYAIMLEGELVAIMEEGEAVMRRGDVLIQRGTAHAWRNRTAQIARIAFILIDGRR
jgi:hypothetical protein